MRFSLAGWVVMVVAMGAGLGCSGQKSAHQASTTPTNTGSGGTQPPSGKPAARPAGTNDLGVPLPGDPVIVGTGSGGKLAVSVQASIDTGETNNRVNYLLTSLVTGFAVYETSSGGFHGDALTLTIKQNGDVKAEIRRVGAQFHWEIVNGSGKLDVPEICKVGPGNPNVPSCSPTSSYGIPKALIDLTSGVTLEATWNGQSTPVVIDHAEIQ